MKNLKSAVNYLFLLFFLLPFPAFACMTVLQNPFDSYLLFWFAIITIFAVSLLVFFRYRKYKMSRMLRIILMTIIFFMCFLLLILTILNYRVIFKGSGCIEKNGVMTCPIC